MALKTPNRTGQLGTYNTGWPNTVTLSGGALGGMRTFASALADGKLSDGDIVGVSIKKVGADSDWAVCMATYDATAETLSIIEQEDSGGSLVDGDAVESFSTVTDAMLASVSLDYTPIVYQVGQDYWDYATAGLTWDSSTGEAQLTGNQVYAIGTWTDGFAASRVSFEIFVPVGADVSTLSFSVIVGDGWSVGNWADSDIRSGVVAGDWASFDFSMSSFSGTPPYEHINYLSGYSSDTLASQYKLRKLRFY